MTRVVEKLILLFALLLCCHSTRFTDTSNSPGRLSRSSSIISTITTSSTLGIHRGIARGYRIINCTIPPINGVYLRFNHSDLPLFISQQITLIMASDKHQIKIVNQIHYKITTGNLPFYLSIIQGVSLESNEEEAVWFITLDKYPGRHYQYHPGLWYYSISLSLGMRPTQKNWRFKNQKNITRDGPKIKQLRSTSTVSTSTPTLSPTNSPITANPTSEPTTKPPTSTPTHNPTAPPTSTPTDKPTIPPTSTPTHNPTAQPTPNPPPIIKLKRESSNVHQIMIAGGAFSIVVLLIIAVVYRCRNRKISGFHNDDGNKRQMEHTIVLNQCRTISASNTLQKYLM